MAKAKSKKPPVLVCACGCGTSILGRGRRKYVDKSHKQRAYRERKALKEQGVTIGATEPFPSSSRPRERLASRARGGYIEVVLKEGGHRIGQLLKVGKGKVMLRLQGPEGEVAWVPWERVRARYSPDDPETAPTGGLKVLDQETRESWLEGFL